MRDFNLLNIKINKKSLDKKDLDNFLTNLENDSKNFSDSLFFKESINWLKVYSFLLGLYEKNNFTFSGKDWKSQEIEYTKLYKTINEMDDAGLFQYSQWAIGGDCSLKVIDLTDYRNFVYKKISNRLNDLQKKFQSNEKTRLNYDKELLTFYKYDKLPSKPDYPLVVLEKDNWDDFGYKTSFRIYYHSSENQIQELGFIKILNKNQKETQIPSEFKKLGTQYCSLGQSEEYYGKLLELKKTRYENILDSLDDVIFKPEIYKKFENHDGFKTSLLRGSEAEKTLTEVWNYFHPSPQIPEDKFNFIFSTHLEEALSPHKLSFDFSISEYLPFRIMAIIGENGTGKTKILNRLAQSLSGLKKVGDFDPQRPLFSKIVLISYSPFDEFVEGKDQISYSYFGLLNEKNQVDFEKAMISFKKSLKQIHNKNLIESWRNTISIIMDDNIVNNIIYNSNLTSTNIDDVGLSSGQKILTLILTNIMATISRDSLILFDEPETFLHPSLVSKLMNAFYKLLRRFNSYAIISTHSPIVLQEIPSKNVIVLERYGNHPSTRKLSIECFGENLSEITNEVFGIESTDVNYKKYLDEMVHDLTYEDILNSFNNNLSFNARMYLKAKLIKK